MQKIQELTKKQKTILISVLAVLAAVVLVYLGGVYYYSSHFLPNTQVDGISAANQTAATINAELSDKISTRSVTINTKDDKSVIISAGDISLNYSDDGQVEDLLDSQNPWSWPAAALGLDKSTLTTEDAVTLDENQLNTKISSLDIITSPEIVAPANAQISYNSETGVFEVSKEVEGNQIDAAKLAEAVKSALSSGTETIVLTETDVYNQPSVKSDNEKLNSDVQKLNQNLNAKVDYVLGENTETVDKDVYASWLSVDDAGNIAVSDEGIQSFLNKIDNYYYIYASKEEAEAQYKAMTAYILNLDDEATRIKNAIVNQQQEKVEPESVVVTPVPLSQTSSIDPSTGALTNSQGGDTYVLIDIASQSMFFWKNGELIVSTPITSGTAGLYDTPTGKYQLQGKSVGVTLRGDGYASYVNYWMPFYNDYGIHDSSWRQNYGGSVYLTSGSHGCVNTPYDAATVLFNNIEVGTTVIVQ